MASVTIMLAWMYIHCVLLMKFFKKNDLPRDFQTCKTAEFQQPLGRYNSARSTCRSWAISRARGGAGGVTSGGTKWKIFGGTSTTF